MLIGLSFLIPSVKTNLLISTILLAISRVCSSICYFYCSKCILLNRMHGNLGIYSINSVDSSRSNRGFCFIWCTCGNNSCKPFKQIRHRLDCSRCLIRKFCYMAHLFSARNFPKIKSRLIKKTYA